MKDPIDPPAICAEAENEALSELGRKIQASYKRGIELRKQSNGLMIDIGREIIETCRDKKVQAIVAAENAKNGKRGGTPTRIHSWVADALAAKHGYNPDYLKQCARQFIAGANIALGQTRQPLIEYQKGGLLKIEVKDLPEVVLKPPITEVPTAPRGEMIFDEGPKPVPPPPPSTEDDGMDLAKLVISKALNGRDLNKPVIEGLIVGLQPVLEQHGFTIQHREPHGGKKK